MDMAGVIKLHASTCFSQLFNNLYHLWVKETIQRQIIQRSLFQKITRTHYSHKTTLKGCGFFPNSTETIISLSCRHRVCLTAFIRDLCVSVAGKTSACKSLWCFFKHEEWKLIQTTLLSNSYVEICGLQKLAQLHYI